VTLTATDALGRTASDRFAVVAFRAGLASPTLPAVLDRYDDASVPIPPHFRAEAGGPSVVSTDNTPAENPITNAGATLGRVLFYDRRLSASDGTSCASCHVQALGFSDAPRLSTGFAGGFTGRHSPGLANARYYQRGRFFWDERAASLEAQVLTPVQDKVEMGMTLDALTRKLAATPYYPALFAQAFGTRDVTSDRIARALAQYVRSLSSADSRFDRAFAAGGPPDFSGFTAQERAGEQIFRTSGCAGCHTTVAQVSDAVHNTGLDAADTDAGAGGGAFKAPSLRNVAVRPRFMHDGRFTALEQVVEFYDTGVQANPNLDRRLRTPDGRPRRLNLGADGRAALVAFLRTLTDSAFLTAARFSNPFAAATPQAPAAVGIQGNAYHPASLTVSPGAAVAFTNLDGTRHSAQFDATQIVSTPIFTSGTQTVTMPSAPGTYTYHCAVHGVAMSGTVTVR
jgi:cytochrome c peroxidase